MWVCGSAALKPLIRSLVKLAAMPDSRVSSCERGAAAPDEQAELHNERRSSAAVIVRRREEKQDDVVVTEPFPEGEAGLYGTSTPSEGAITQFGGVKTIDDKWAGCSVSSRRA